jgi:ATP-dependent RNA helicase DeaD
MAHDWAAIAQFLSPLVQRVDESATDLQLVIIASNDELSAVIAAAAVKLFESRPVGIVAATSARRAARLLRLRPAQVVAGTPEVLVELVRGAAIKLESVKHLAIAWIDDLVTRGGVPTLETLMTDVPKDATRAVVTSELSPAVEALLERYARRARRVVSPAAEGDRPVNVEYVSVSSATRLRTLRRVLDELDPASAMVFARDSESELQARDLIRALGYGAPDAPVFVGLAAPPETELVVLLDLPASREELREAASAAKRAVALVQPQQVTSLRALAAGGTLKPLTLPEAGVRSRDRDARMRAELRAVLERGDFGRELLALEPLLDEFDGIEIAAAAAQLLESERAARAEAPAAAAARAPSSPARESLGMVRLFVNVGSRDNVRPADLIGAITNEAGVTNADVGKIELRESHAVVEVAASVADQVIERVTGTPIRGRRAVVRRDEGKKREGGPADRDRSRPHKGPPRDASRDDTRGRRGAADSRGDSRRSPGRPRPTPRSPRPEGRE